MLLIGNCNRIVIILPVIVFHLLKLLDVCSLVKEVEEATVPAAAAASHHLSESKGDEQLVRQLMKLVEQLREDSLATSREIAELRQEKENEREELGRRIGALQRQHENEREELGRQIKALQQQKENEREEQGRQIEALQQQKENEREEQGRQIEALQQQKENEREELGRQIEALQQQNENEREEQGRQIEALQQQNEFLGKELRLKQLQREHAIAEAVDTEGLLEETDDGKVQLLLFMLPFLFSTILMKF